MSKTKLPMHELGPKVQGGLYMPEGEGVIAGFYGT